MVKACTEFSGYLVITVLLISAPFTTKQAPPLLNIPFWMTVHYLKLLTNHWKPWNKSYSHHRMCQSHVALASMPSYKTPNATCRLHESHTRGLWVCPLKLDFQVVGSSAVQPRWLNAPDRCESKDKKRNITILLKNCLELPSNLSSLVGKTLL